MGLETGTYLKRRTVAVSALLIALTTQTIASADELSSGLMIEPIAGYEKGYYSQTGIPSADTQTIHVGGRLGYRFSRILAGVQGSIGLWGKADQTGIDGDFKPTDLGLFLGYDIGLNIRVLASYYVFAKAKIQATENPEQFSGYGMRASLSWAGLPFGALNLDFTNRTYSSYGGTDLTNSIKSSAVNLSLSLPVYL